MSASAAATQKRLAKDEDFDEGMYVFAKLKGHPFWPAKIVAVNKGARKPYLVHFYGTNESASILPVQMRSYIENRKSLGFPKLKRTFNKALYEIETELMLMYDTQSGENEPNAEQQSQINPADETPSTSPEKIRRSRKRRRPVKKPNRFVQSRTANLSGLRQCMWCNKSVTNPTVHAWWHTKLKPRLCSHCKMTFEYGDHKGARQHAQTHSPPALIMMSRTYQSIYRTTHTRCFPLPRPWKKTTLGTLAQEFVYDGGESMNAQTPTTSTVVVEIDEPTPERDDLPQQDHEEDDFEEEL